jgi:hypothetical protein
MAKKTVEDEQMEIWLKYAEDHERDGSKYLVIVQAQGLLGGEAISHDFIINKIADRGWKFLDLSQVTYGLQSGLLRTTYTFQRNKKHTR